MKAEELFKELRELDSKSTRTFLNLTEGNEINFMTPLLEDFESEDEEEQWEEIVATNQEYDIPIIMICPNGCINPFDVYVLFISDCELYCRTIDEFNRYTIRFNDINDVYNKIAIIEYIENL